MERPTFKLNSRWKLTFWTFLRITFLSSKLATKIEIKEVIKYLRSCYIKNAFCLKVDMSQPDNMTKQNVCYSSVVCKVVLNPPQHKLGQLSAVRFTKLTRNDNRRCTCLVLLCEEQTPLNKGIATWLFNLVKKIMIIQQNQPSVLYSKYNGAFQCIEKAYKPQPEGSSQGENNTRPPYWTIPQQTFFWNLFLFIFTILHSFF